LSETHAKKDYYGILGVSKDASDAEIKKSISSFSHEISSR